MDTRDMTPGERRELRSIVKKQFQTLRSDVKHRQEEMAGEVEEQLLHRYRQQDAAIEQAEAEAQRAFADYTRALDGICSSLRALHPELHVSYGSRLSSSGYGLMANDPRRQQEKRALIANIPRQVNNAMSRLEHQELDMLRDLTVGALDTEQATAFLNAIPTVAQLVPRARLMELENPS